MSDIKAVIIFVLIVVILYYDASVIIRRLNAEKKMRIESIKKHIKDGWSVYKNGVCLTANDLKTLNLEKYEISLSEDQRSVYLKNDEELIAQAKEYALAGWTVYKNGSRIDSDAFESLYLKGYVIIINKEKKIINLKPKGRWLV